MLTLDGRERRNLDNAASTPALRAVLDAVERLPPLLLGRASGNGTRRGEHRRLRAGPSDRRRSSRHMTSTTRLSSPRTRRRPSTGWPARCGRTTTRWCSPRCSAPLERPAVAARPGPGRPPRSCTSASARRDARHRPLRSAARRARRPGGLVAVARRPNVTGVVAGPPAGPQGARGGRPPAGRRRPARRPPRDRYASPPRSGPPRLRRPVGPQAVRALRHRRSIGDRRALPPSPTSRAAARSGR